MSKREDLEHLAEECETCALEADESIDSHLIQCQSCVDHAAKAKEIERMVEQMTAMSMQADEERSEIMVKSIEEYMAMDDKARTEALRDMFEDVSELNEAQRTVIIKTRTDIMTSLPKEERNKMLHSARHIYSNYDMDRKVQEEQAILSATRAYKPLKRTLVRRMYRNLMK